MPKKDGLPKCMYLKHGAYYLVRRNQWVRLSANYHDALVEYARLTAGPDKAALSQLVTRTLADLKAEGLSESTLKNYRLRAAQILEAFAEFSPQQIMPRHVAMFLDNMKHMPASANHAHAFLRNMFKRAVRWGIVDADPTRDIQPFKTGKRDRYITPDEWKRIYSQAGETLQVLMDLAYLTGQRVGDCIGIRYADISESGIHIQQKKTKAKVLIEMTTDLQEVIARAKKIHHSVKGLTLLHKRDGKPLAYSTMYGQWKKACELAGVENANIHDIRAAAATDAKADGRDSKTLLGHTTEASHNRYLRSKQTPVATPNPLRKTV